MKPLRTLFTGFLRWLVEPAKQLENDNIIDLVYCFAEANDINYSKYISIMPFLSGSYDEDTISLIKKYTNSVSFNSEIYNHIYKNIYKYTCNLSRHNKDFQYNADINLVHSFNMIYNFLYGLLKSENIELVIFGNAPHDGFHNILYDLCVLLNIKTIFIYSEISPVSNIPFFKYAFNESDAYNAKNMSNIKVRESNEQIYNDFDYKLCYMKDIPQQKMPIFKFKKTTFLKLFLCSLISTKWANRRLIKQLYKKRLLMRKLPLYIDYEKNQQKYSQKPDFECNYVYFPLHLQPELTTQHDGGFWQDQIFAIERLREILPKDWYIYVKENPKQNEYMRGDLFYKRLHMIDNVKYIDKSVSTIALLKNCKFCSTINGTAAFESVTGGKPALIFGSVWWDFLPGIIKYNKDLKLDDILNYKIDIDDVQKKFNEFLSTTHLGTVQEFEYFKESCPELTEKLNVEVYVNLLKNLISEVK